MSAGVAGKPVVGVFRTVFPVGSETFIREQMAFMRAVEPKVFARDFDAAAGYDGVGIASGWRKKLWTLTRWPGCFPAPRWPVRLLHAHFGQDGVMALPLAQRLGIPLVTTFHGADITTAKERFARSNKPTQRWFAYKEPELRQHGSGFVAVSRFIEERLLAAGYARDRVRQIYIGIDTERFTPAPPAGGDERPYLLCVARHTPKKGLDTLIKAWARVASRHPGVRLLQVGGGGITEIYQRQVAELGVGDSFEFLGPRNHQQVLQLMQRALAFVLPSQTAEDGDSEALGIVFNEASACGIPVLSTFHGGIPEAVRHGENGLLCAERDDTALAAHIDALIADRSLAQSLGRRGRELVCDEFDIRKQTPVLEAFYSEIIERHAAGH